VKLGDVSGSGKRKNEEFEYNLRLGKESIPGPLIKELKNNRGGESVMRWQSLSVAVVALAMVVVISAGVSHAQAKPATKATTPNMANVPADYKTGITELRVAKGYLEKAGDKWGGYRIKGIAQIDNALKALLGTALASQPDEMASGNTDEPSMMNAGIQHLQSAKADLNKAGDNWGGKRENALRFIDQALADLQAGINYAKQNKTY
jgi:hypothetical protein